MTVAVAFAGAAHGGEAVGGRSTVRFSLLFDYALQVIIGGAAREL